MLKLDVENEIKNIDFKMDVWLKLLMINVLNFSCL